MGALGPRTKNMSKNRIFKTKALHSALYFAMNNADDLAVLFL
jgi:hypothetical protein